MKNLFIMLICTGLLLQACSPSKKMDPFIEEKTENAKAVSTAEVGTEIEKSSEKESEEEPSTGNESDNTGETVEERMLVDLDADSWLNNKNMPELAFQNCIPLPDQITVNSAGMYGLYYAFCSKCKYSSVTMDIFSVKYEEVKRYDYHCDLCGTLTVVKFAIDK